MGRAAEVSVRRAAAADVDAVHQVLVSAFVVASGTPRWDYLRHLAEGWPRLLVGERAGEPVAALRLQPDRVRLGPGAVLLKGDVGYVSVRRDLHGQGLGTALMRGAVALMAEEGFSLSRLGGLNAFYVRFGYVPFPRLTYEFPLDTVHAGADTLRPEDFLHPVAEDEARLRPYDPRTDASACRRLEEVFAAGHAGALVPGAEESAPDDEPAVPGLQWTYRDDQGLAAYVTAAPEGETLQICHVGAEPTRLPALAATIKRVLWEAACRGARSATGYLPRDLAVQEALVAAGVPFVLREAQGSPASNMLLLVSLRDFCGQALPEWSRRLREAGGPPWRGSLDLRVDGEAVRLAFDAEGVRLAGAAGSPDALLTLPRRAFLLGALGLRGWDEIASCAADPVSAVLGPTLAALFRRWPVVGGPLG